MPFRMDAHRKSGNVSEKRGACNVLFQVSVMKVLRETKRHAQTELTQAPIRRQNGTVMPFRSCGRESANDGQTLDIDFRCAHQVLVDLAPDFDLGVGVHALDCEIFLID